MHTAKTITWVESTAAEGATFWEKLGPLATDASVAKELGSGVVNTGRHRWLFGMDGDEVVAMAALAAPAKDGDPAWIDMAYVRPANRRDGLWTEMFNRRMSMAAAAGYSRVRVCTRVLAQRLTAEGFSVYRQAGSWSYMEKAI